MFPAFAARYANGGRSGATRGLVGIVNILNIFTGAAVLIGTRSKPQAFVLHAHISGNGPLAINALCGRNTRIGTRKKVDSGLFCTQNLSDRLFL